MVSNEEIMDMLKVILEKLERLEGIKAGKITLEKGTINLQLDSGNQTTPISIKAEEADIDIAANARTSINISAEDISGDIQIDTGAYSPISIECEEISGDIHTKEAPKKD